jgi:hypothetical protein
MIFQMVSSGIDAPYAVTILFASAVYISVGKGGCIVAYRLWKQNMKPLTDASGPILRIVS